MKHKQIAVVTLLFMSLFWGVLSTSKINSQSSSVTLENASFRYSISHDGKNLNFIDKTTGTDYCKRQTESYCAHIAKDGKNYFVTSVTSENGKIIMEFGSSKVSVVLKTTVNKNNIILEVQSVSGGDPDSLLFVNVPLTLQGNPEESFAACALALNLFTNVTQVPALQTHLMAACYQRFSLVGARVAIIGVPMAQILPTIREILVNEPGVPHTTGGGAWAMDSPTGRGSYLMNFGTLTEETVDEWIAMVKNLGFNQIVSHGGGKFFRWGDFYLNPEKWPKGWENFKNINKRLHEAGLKSIILSYAFFIEKQSKYVTPVPHKQLGAFRTFTLAEPIDDKSSEIQVIESTKDVSTVIGFFVRNSLTLQIDDELVTFGGVTKEQPYKFTGLKRGVNNTKISSHTQGAKARHLKEMFGLFVPDPESELFEEIARTHAEIVNNCDFDGIYFDADDGSDILGGWENYWYYAPKFIFLVSKYLKKQIGMEMSTMNHHFWNFRSNWQSWDRPTRGYKRFVDIHLAANKTDSYEHGMWQGHKPLIDKYAPLVNGPLLLPLHLGWWGLQTWNPPQVEPTFSDDMEYLGCKMIGNDAGLSMLGGVDKENLQKVPGFKRAVDTIRQYETLRQSKYFDESVKKKLREPGKEFILFQDNNEKWNFKPASYDKHKVEGINNWSSTWQVNNPYQEQPVKLRIEALMSAGPYDAPENIVLTDFTNETSLPVKNTANGVMLGLQSSSDQVKAGTASGSFAALNSGEVNQDGAWAMVEKSFEPWINLNKHQALGVWVYGDGQGELLNVRLESPLHLSYGAKGDHYIIMNFIGWRYFELIEIESTRHSDYVWPGSSLFVYDSYRHTINFENIEKLSVWYNNLPPNKKVKCYISTIKALPMIPVKFKNPEININGRTLVFPVEMESGNYLEFNSMSDCKLYGKQGELLAQVSPRGDVPVLQSGSNEAAFNGEGPSGINLRTNVTVISTGNPF